VVTEREKIAARIRALLAKTVTNGCTEPALYAFDRASPTTTNWKTWTVLRRDLIRSALEAEGVKLKDTSARRSRDYESTYYDGQRAGDRVGLNRSLGGQARPSSALGRGSVF
jgi:hypothetical protein